MSIELSLIIPVLNERDLLPELIKQIEVLRPAETIIVDGGSDDGSWEWLQEHWQGRSDSFTLLSTTTGRAQQMNVGAQSAQYDVLLFLHADTQLPINAKELILNAAPKANLETFWGRFDVRFSTFKNPKSMAVIAYFINLRSRVSNVATGDQAIFVSRYLFKEIRGFDDIEIMEDVAFSKKLRRIERPLCLRAAVISSARRWERNGVMATVIQMWLFRLAFVLGVTPARLKRSYRNVR